MSFIAAIPARFASTRLPGKPLADIHGKAMIVHVVERAKKSGAKRVIVATDSRDIIAVIEGTGAEACFTSQNHQSGTERLAEVVDCYNIPDEEIIVNVQGDEPLIEPGLIAQVANDLACCPADVSVATIATPISDKQEVLDPNIVKVVLDVSGNAMYFSRAPIPWDRDGATSRTEGIGSLMLRHVGLYAYRASFLRKYRTWQATRLEQVEALEQLRILYYGEKIHVSTAASVRSISVDTAQDLERVRNLDLVESERLDSQKY